jgi:hypothetical protein
MVEFITSLNLNQPVSKDKIQAEQRKCSCLECNNEGTAFLKIVHLPSSGYFCAQCSCDLKWHGIAQEIIPVGKESGLNAC